MVLAGAPWIARKTKTVELCPAGIGKSMVCIDHPEVAVAVKRPKELKFPISGPVRTSIISSLVFEPDILL